MSFNKEKLVRVVHARVLALRNIETLVSLRDFQQLYDGATEEQKQKAHQMIDDFNHDGLRKWYKFRRLEQLTMLGVRELRQLASQMCIPNYNHLTKPLLLSEISRKRDAEKPIDHTDSGVTHGNGSSYNPIGSNGDSVQFAIGCANGSARRGFNGPSHLALGNPKYGV